MTSSQRKEVPLTKQPIENNSEDLEWKAGPNDSNLVLGNRNLGVEVNRYIITSSDGNICYDTISIKERSTNTVVVVVNEAGKIGLIREWRPIPEKWFWACPRGFGDKEDKSNLVTAKRELIEEIGNCKIIDGVFLGVSYQNSAYFENPIGIVVLRVKQNKKILDESEGIVEFKFFPPERIFKMISENEIEDQFTISAITKYLSPNMHISK